VEFAALEGIVSATSLVGCWQMRKKNRILLTYHSLPFFITVIRLKKNHLRLQMGSTGALKLVQGELDFPLLLNVGKEK